MQTELFFLEFTLTNYCNETCEYCDLASTFKNHSTKVEADLDKFKWIINSLDTNNLYIELCGGEPGLVSNLPDFIDFINSCDKVKKTQLMSNGLVRAIHPELIERVDHYNEHIIKNIEYKHINKFYNLPFEFRKNTRYVVVLDYYTTYALYYNFDHWKEFGLFNESNFWLKNYVDRTNPIHHKHKELLFLLYDKINTSYAKYSAAQLSNENEIARTVCKKISFLPVINLETDKIIHCAYHNFTSQLEKELTQENLSLLLTKRLFFNDNPSYCENCHLYFDDYKFLLSNNKANRK